MASRCPICKKYIDGKAEVIKHVSKYHREDIPVGMSVAQYIYMLNHNGRANGICRYCGNETPWNEKTGKPYQICTSKECREKNKEIAHKRMIDKYGKTHLLDDPIQQEKMLANRHISGVYDWSDGRHKFVYTGSYEKAAIEWLDKVANLDPDTIQMPGIIIPYKFNGETKNWITDIYLTEFNLVVEIKDGGENTHPGFKINREKEAAKDAAMKEQNLYNYVKVTHKDMSQLLAVMELIKNNNILSTHNNECERLIVINEAAALDSIKEQKPIGKQRVAIEDGVKRVKFLPNEASGYSDRRDKLKMLIEANPHNVYLTSDIHIGRHYPDVTLEDPTHKLNIVAAKINSYINKDTILIFLGDIVHNADLQYVKITTTKLLDKLVADKVVLVLGNNDNISVTDAYDCGYYYVTDRLDTDKYLFTHMPDRIPIHKYNIHGHIHGGDTLYNIHPEGHVDVFYDKYDSLHSLADFCILSDIGRYDYMKTVRKEF